MNGWVDLVSMVANEIERDVYDARREWPRQVRRRRRVRWPFGRLVSRIRTRRARKKRLRRCACGADQRYSKSC